MSSPTPGSPVPPAVGRSESRPQRSRRRIVQKVLTPYLLIAPGIGLVIWILGLAVWDSVVLSMRQYPFMIIGEPIFVGASNYLRLFQDPVFQASFRATVIFVLGTVSLGLVMSTAFAMALHALQRSQKFFSALNLVPFLLSGVAVGVMWRFLFAGRGGLINLSLETLGQAPVAWMSNPDLALGIVILATIWQKAPVTTLIVLSGLQSIDKQLFEAAAIDGATPWQVFRRITLPLIVPVLGISLIWLNFVAFSMFDIVLAMTRGGPGRATELLAVRMYYLAFEQFDVVGGAAILVILLTINITVSFLVIRTFRV